MSRAALLLVVGEAFNEKQKSLILEKIAEDLHSWDDDASHCDLEKELENFSGEMKSLGDVAVSGTALTYNSDSLSLSILFSPDRKLLHDSLQNFLLIDSHYRHLVYAGQTVAGSGSWILPDDVFTFRNFVKVLKEMDSVGAGGDGKGFALNVSSTSEWDWSKGNFARLSGLGVKIAGSASEKGRKFDVFRSFLDPLLVVIDLRDVLKASSTVGMINFSGPTLYVFPGGNGSSALFGVKGFTGLVDGGYSRKSCSWHFSRHLHQIDMVILSHLGVDNFLGMESFLERKIETGSPDVGSVFFNCPEKFRKLSPNPESLKVNLFDAGAALSEKLSAAGLHPQPLFAPLNPLHPITLYNKVGFGSVDMYVLNPIQNAEEMKSFLHQWSTRVESESFSAHSGVPLSNALSVSVLLVWKPFSPSAKIIRILFPGGTSQSKIFEGLDRLKNVAVFERSECSQVELSAKPGKVTQGRPTTLKPTTAKSNGILDLKESAKSKAMNGSKDSVAGRSKPDPVPAKTGAIQRATKVEPKKPETSPTNGTSTPKSATKPTASPSKPAKDVKLASSRNVENPPTKRLSTQKVNEVEALPRNKAAAKAPQAETAKQTKPARRAEEVKTSETVKQTKQATTEKEAPAAKPLNIAKDSRAARHSEPPKQTKPASMVTETAKPGTPKAVKVSKDSDKKGTKPAEPKKSEKKDQEKEVKREVEKIQPVEGEKIQPVEDAIQTKSPEAVVSEPVCIAATEVEQTSSIPPSRIIADGVLGGEAAPRTVEYDLPSPEDVAQMSQEDEDSFVEELPTETEPVNAFQAEEEAGLAPDPELIVVDRELRDDVVLPNDHHGEKAIRDFDQNNEIEVVTGDLVYGLNVPGNLESAEFSNGREVVDDNKVDAELEEDLEFERDEVAVENLLDDSVEDAIDEEVRESAQLGQMQDPDVIPDCGVSGVRGEVEDEGADEGKEKEGQEDLICREHLDSVRDQGSVVAEQAAHEGNDFEKEVIEKDLDFEKEDIIEKVHHLEKKDRDKDGDFEKDGYFEEHRELEKEHHLEVQHAEKDFAENDDHLHRDKDLDFQNDENVEKHDVEKEEPNSWLLQDSRSALGQGAFQVKRQTDGLARYCEEFGSDEGGLAEDEDQNTGEKYNADLATCPGGFQGQGRKVDEEEEEDEADELEAVEEEEEMEEDEETRIGGVEQRDVPEIGCEFDVVTSEDVVANGVYLPDVLGHEEHFGKEEDAEILRAIKAEAAAGLLSSEPKVQGDRKEELNADEGFDRGDDFSKEGADKGFGSAEEDFGRFERDPVRSEGFFDNREDDRDADDDDKLNDEEEERMIAEMEGRDDDASDVDLSEGHIPGERSGDILSDDEAAEAKRGASPLESVDDVLPCVLKKDTAIENLAAICAETKEESSENTASHSSGEVVETRPDLVAACEASAPHDVEAAFETEEKDGGVSIEGPDVVEAERTDESAYRLETEEHDYLSLEESGISQGKPNDLGLFNEEEEPCSLDNVAADLAQEVIQSSLAAQNPDSSACFASGPVSASPLSGTEKPHGSTLEADEDVSNLLNTMVDAVATSDTTSGQCNYGFDENRKEDASAADPSFGGAAAVVEPADDYKEKSGEDSGESDLDEGQDACHLGQRGLELGNEPDDGSRLDEGFEESTGDESPANVMQLLHHQRAEEKTGEGPCAFAYGASGEVASEKREEPSGSAGGPASEKVADEDESRPLVDFDSDVSAAHQAESGHGCVAAHRDATDAWQRNNLNPFLDPFPVEAAEKVDLITDGEKRISSEAGYHQHTTAGGLDSEESDRKLEGDEESIPSDDNEEQRGSDDLKVTPEAETAECNRTSSFWTYQENPELLHTTDVINHGAADNISYVARDINENLGVANGAEEESPEDLDKLSTQSNASEEEEEGESRSSAVLSEQHDGAESLDSSDVEADPVKSWGQPMGLPAPALDSGRGKLKMGSRPTNDAANLTLPVLTNDRKPPAAAKSADRSFVAPQKKTSDVRKSAGAALKTDANESKENGSVKNIIAKKSVSATAAAAPPTAKKLTTTSSDTSSKSKPLKHVVPFYVDLTYIPGSGEPAYVDADFFRRVRAHYYVLSSVDPDPRVLSCLVEGKQAWEKKDLAVNVIPTHDSSVLHRWFHDNAKLVEELKISLLPAANKCTIKLQDKDDGCYAFRIEF